MKIELQVLTDSGTLEKDINEKVEVGFRELKSYIKEYYENNVIVLCNKNKTLTVTNNSNLLTLQILNPRLTWKDII